METTFVIYQFLLVTGIFSKDNISMAKNRITRTFSNQPFFQLLLFVFLPLVIIVVIHHYFALRGIPPIQDASNNVSKVSNLGLLLNRRDWNSYWYLLSREPNNFLSMAYFSAFSSVFGPGRIAWGWAWAVAATSITWISFLLARNKEQRKLVALPFLLFACSTPLIYRVGGILDQRFDIFSVLLLIASVSALLSQRVTLAAWFSLAAIYAKGPAIPIVGLLWITAICSRAMTIRSVMEKVIQNWVSWIFLLGAALYYKWAYFPSVMAYNLMAVHSVSSGLRDRVNQFFRTLGADFFYYFRTLAYSSPVAILLLIVGTWLLISKKTPCYPKTVLRWGYFLLICIYLLFTSHPVHAEVLLAWFLPAFWILVIGLALIILDKKPQGLPLRTVSAIAFFSWTYVIAANYLPVRFRISSGEQAYWNVLQASSDQLSEEIEKRGSQDRPVRLLVNFLHNANLKFHLNYDTFRVLLFERLGRRSPILLGWELETRSDHWQEELQFGSQERILVLLSNQGADWVHHHNHANLLAKEVHSAISPFCRPLNVHTAKIDVWGELSAYFVSPDLKHCL